MQQQLKGMEYLDWMSKADGDRDAASIEYLYQNHPDIACYHVQQAMEKYLKAQLVSFDVAPRQSHNISALLDDLSAAAGVEFDKNLRYYARTLTSYEASARYPGPELTQKDYERAIDSYDHIASSLSRDDLEIPAWNAPITYVDINPESQQ